jgi:hypothetical protein
VRFLCQRFAPLLALSLTASACAAVPGQPSKTTLQFQTSHFVFHHSEADRSIVQAVASRVDQSFDRVARDLDAVGMREVDVYFYASHEALATAVASTVGPIPPWATGLVTSASSIHMLGPHASGLSATQAATVITHELTHCVSLYLKPDSANNPRWLWESVALFEAGQWVDPSTLPHFSGGTSLTLSELNQLADRRIYDVGYLLGEFIFARGGLAALRALILNEGNVHQAIGLPAAEFERQWLAFVRQRYAL